MTQLSRKSVCFLIALALAATAAAIGWLAGAPSAASARPSAAVAASPAVVAVGRGRIDVDGGVIQIAAQRDGVIAEVLVEEGQQVKAGQLLARLDDRVPAAALQEARAAADSVRARLPVLALKLQTAEREQRRLVRLVSADAEAQQSLDAANDALRNAQAELAAQRAELRLSESKVHSAQIELAQREVRAPVDGRIARRLARPGAGASTLNVSTLFTLVPSGELVVRVDLEESFLHQVRVGQTVRIRPDVAPEQSLQGRVLRVGEIFGQRKQEPGETQQKVDERVIEVVVSLPDRTMRIGQRALVRFEPAS